MSSSFRPHNLSQREIEVIQLIADGLTDKEIAARLCITARTVSEHIINIRSKLGASNRASAVFRYFYKSMSQRAQAEAVDARPAQENNMSTGTHYILRPADASKDAAEFAPTTYLIDSSMWQGTDSILDPMTEAQVAQRLADGMNNPMHRFFVVEDDEQAALGYSQLTQEPWTAPSGRALSVMVKHDRRGWGVGTALYDDAVTYCRSQNVKQLNVMVADHDRASLRFALKRGFRQTWHHLTFELDLTRFDAGRFDGLLDMVRDMAIRIASVADFDNSEDARRKLFQVNAWCAALDLPGVTDEPSWDSFEQFDEAVCKSKWYQPEGQLVAIDEQTGEWIGMAATTVTANGACNLHTGVDRRYRHDPRIGQALKLASIQYAKRKGATRVRDDHAVRDATNLSINYVMGYDITAGWIILEKKLS